MLDTPETAATTPEARPQTPITVNIAMFGGSRAGKTSLLAGMYRGVRGEVRRVGLGIRRRNPETTRTLDAATAALERLPQIVADDPTLMVHQDSVEGTPRGEVRRFDFVLQGSKVDVATLRFYDFAGEDIKDHASTVEEGLRDAHIILVAINTPPLMEAYANPDYEQLHMDWNLPDQLDYLLDSWSGRGPLLVMLAPIKSERWLHGEDDVQLLRRAVSEMYHQSLTLLERPQFKDTTVVLAPVETVGSVAYTGLERYDPALPPTPENVVFSFERRGDAAVWAPRYHEQPFRWTLLSVTRAVTFGAIAEGKGGGWWQNLVATAGDRYMKTGLPVIKAVEEVFDDQAGLSGFKTATAQLAEGRLLDPPFHLFRRGSLMEPVDE